MESYQIAVTVTAVAAVIGLSAGLVADKGIKPGDLDIQVPDLNRDSSEANSTGEAAIGRPGSTHEHALFHVVVNGSEKDLTSERFQFNSRYVHLENNRSDIVHKHAVGVTWKMFLDTVNISASTAKNQTCLEIYGNSTCGSGAVVLNGKVNISLEKEISQGDNLLIILDTEDWRKVSKRYMRQELPPGYRPQERGGRSL